MLRSMVAVVIITLILSCQNNSADTTQNQTNDTVSRQKVTAVNVIFDTDMGPDYDDVGAIAMLHSFADSGYANILATVASTKYEGVAAVLDAFNTYFNRPDIPIGVPSQKASVLRDVQHWSDTVRKNYHHSINSNSDADDAVKLYRRILAQQPDTSVTIITVGFLTNISNLLKSQADSISPLNGKELVNQKVKEMVSMAGKFPEGSEFNVNIDAAASQYAFEHFMRPVILSGFEIGEKIKTGLPLIADSSIKNSPVKDVFRISIPMAEEDSAGRMSWDETAVLVGVLGHQKWYTLNEGRITVDNKGYNKWDSSQQKHAHLVARTDPSEVQAVINKLIMHQPVK